MDSAVHSPPEGTPDSSLLPEEVRAVCRQDFAPQQLIAAFSPVVMYISKSSVLDKYHTFHAPLQTRLDKPSTILHLGVPYTVSPMDEIFLAQERYSLFVLPLL
jgi:hypothetical protein